MLPLREREVAYRYEVSHLGPSNSMVPGVQHSTDNEVGLLLLCLLHSLIWLYCFLSLFTFLFQTLSDQTFFHRGFGLQHG